MPAGGCNDGWMAALTVALEDCSAIFLIDVRSGMQAKVAQRVFRNFGWTENVENPCVFYRLCGERVKNTSDLLLLYILSGLHLAAPPRRLKRPIERQRGRKHRSEMQLGVQTET